MVSLVFDKAVSKCTYPNRKRAHMFDFVDEEPVVCLFAMAWAKDETTATFWHANGLSPSSSGALVLQGWGTAPILITDGR